MYLCICDHYHRTCVAPLERIKLECIIHGPKCTWVRTIRSIWAKEGLMGFWKGNVLNLFRTVPFKSINFICYDMYCDRLLRVQGAKEITNHDRLIGGGISGITATILCLPLDTVSHLSLVGCNKEAEHRVIVKQTITHKQSHIHKERYTKLLHGLKNCMLGCVLYFKLTELF